MHTCFMEYDIIIHYFIIHFSEATTYSIRDWPQLHDTCCVYYIIILVLLLYFPYHATIQSEWNLYIKDSLGPVIQSF